MIPQLLLWGCHKELIAKFEKNQQEAQKALTNGALQTVFRFIAQRCQLPETPAPLSSS